MGADKSFFFFSPQTTDEWNEENSGWVSVRVTGNVSEDRDNKYRKCLGEKKKSVKTEINFQPIKTSSSYPAVIKNNI